MSRIKIVQKNTFDVVRSAVNQSVDLVKPTFGPAGNKVIISKVTHGFVLDDGVQILRDLELEDAAENAVLKVLRETAIKTNDRVGDGTTGSVIMVQAIIEEVAKLGKINGRKIEKELKEALAECKKQLLDSSKTIATKEELLKVAQVSFDDKKIAKLIADAWFAIGKDGVLTVDRSGTMETTVEMTDGIKINRGYNSPYMITNPQRMEAVVEKPYILFTDYRLTEVNDIIGIMNKLVEKQILSLVIIADNVEGNALATLIVNKAQGKFVSIAVNRPADEATLEDMALMTGGKVFSQKKGDKLDKITIADLGRAERFVATRTESVIIGPKADKAEMKQIMIDLNLAFDSSTNEQEKAAIRQRYSRFANKIGVIKVGAPTENELNALKYKVEDSVNCTLAAYKSGVACGGGIALMNLKTSSDIMNAALQAPFRQLKINMGLDEHRPLKKDEAINMVTGEIGNYLKVGVMDPVDVLIAQLESAVSIASTLITSSGMIVEKPQHIRQQ